MITVEGIKQKYGYTGRDHMLDDGPYQDLLGAEFESVRSLRIAIYEIDKEQDSNNRGAPFGVTIRFASGEVTEIEL